MATIDVIIINWNGRHLLGACLSTLLRSEGVPFAVTVYDNGSTDGSVDYVRQAFPTIRVLTGKTNIGFSPAVNEVIRATSGEYVVLLNNDTEVEPNWLAELVDAAAIDRGVGMVASRMLFWSDPDRINSAGIDIDRCGIAWDRLGGALASSGDEPAEIFGPSGGAALYRRSMLDRIGLFDDDFFAYLEDVDLAWRAQLAGWRCLYAPRARLRHHHSATGREGSPLKNFLLGRNKVWSVFKNYPAPEIYRYLPAILSYDLGTVPYRLLLKGDLHSLRGRLAGLAGLPVILQQRRLIQRLATGAGRRQAWALMRPVEPPWSVLARYRHLARVATG